MPGREPEGNHILLAVAVALAKRADTAAERGKVYAQIANDYKYPVKRSFRYPVVLSRGEAVEAKSLWEWQSGGGAPKSRPATADELARAEKETQIIRADSR
jgi:hypothetical protein